MMPKSTFPTSVPDPHYFDTAPAALAPAPLYTKPTFLKQTIVHIKVEGRFFFCVYFKMPLKGLKNNVLGKE
jgi:hypothetical protein